MVGVIIPLTIRNISFLFREKKILAMKHCSWPLHLYIRNVKNTHRLIREKLHWRDMLNGWELQQEVTNALAYTPKLMVHGIRVSAKRFLVRGYLIFSESRPQNVQKAYTFQGNSKKLIKTARIIAVEIMGFNPHAQVLLVQQQQERILNKIENLRQILTL